MALVQHQGDASAASAGSAAGGPSVAAIVPATDRPRTLDRCLEAIRAADQPPEEVIVVAEPLGAGPASARNAGAGRAGAEVVAFVDSDVVVRGDVFARAREAFRADPELTALFGSYDAEPEAPGVVSGFRNLLHHHVHQNSPGPADTFWAGLGFVRRADFWSVGGFDELRYPRPSIEDIELGMRLVGAGARIELDPSLQGTHLKAWTLRDAARTDLLRRGMPWVHLLIERRQVPDHLNLGWRHRASAAVSVMGLAAAARARAGPAAVAAVALVALNRSFYALLLRRRGAAQAVAGVGLHALHHAIGALAVAAALLGRAAAAVGGSHHVGASAGRGRREPSPGRPT